MFQACWLIFFLFQIPLCFFSFNIMFTIVLYKEIHEFEKCKLFHILNNSFYILLYAVNLKRFFALWTTRGKYVSCEDIFRHNPRTGYSSESVKISSDGRITVKF